MSGKQGPLSVLCIVLLFLQAACTGRTYDHYNYKQKDGTKGMILLEREHDSLYIIRHHIGERELSVWQLPYPVFRFECGDLTGDGQPEITVGVVKSTRYSPIPQKRLFIFKLYKGKHIRPLWLGSRMPRPLEDFHIVHDSIPARILTTERKPDGNPCQSLYRLGAFGLLFEQYIDN